MYDVVPSLGGVFSLLVGMLGASRSSRAAAVVVGTTSGLDSSLGSSMPLPLPFLCPLLLLSTSEVKVSISSRRATVSEGEAIQAVVHARRACEELAVSSSIRLTDRGKDYRTYLEIIRTSRQELIANMNSPAAFDTAKVLLSDQNTPGLVANINEDVVATYS